MSNFIVDLDENKKILYSNGKFLRELGIDKNEIKELFFMDLIDYHFSNKLINRAFREVDNNNIFSLFVKILGESLAENFWVEFIIQKNDNKYNLKGTKPDDIKIEKIEKAYNSMIAGQEKEFICEYFGIIGVK